MSGLTIGEQRLRQFPEERLKKATDYVQVLPSLWGQEVEALGLQ